MKTKKRPYLVVSSVAGGERGASTALTREGIMLELAMRLMSQIRPIAPEDAWKKAEQFVRAMDKKLPFEEPVPPPAMTNSNADRPIPDLLK